MRDYGRVLDKLYLVISPTIMLCFVGEHWESWCNLLLQSNVQRNSDDTDVTPLPKSRPKKYFSFFILLKP